VVLFVDARMAGEDKRIYYGAHFGIFFLVYGALSTTVLSSRVSRVGRVSKISVIWLRSKLALNKYRVNKTR